MVSLSWKHMVLGIAAAMIASPAMAGSVKGNHKGNDLPSYSSDHDVKKNDDKHDDKKDDKHDVKKDDKKHDDKDEKKGEVVKCDLPKIVLKLCEIKKDCDDKEVKCEKKQDCDDRFDWGCIFKDHDCTPKPPCEPPHCEKPPCEEPPECHPVPLPPAAWMGVLTMGGAAWQMRKRMGIA